MITALAVLVVIPQDGSRGKSKNTTGSINIWAARSAHLNIPLVSPRGTPRVAHQKVVLALLGRSVSDGRHPVVQIFTARGIIKDARLVQLKASGVGLNGHRHGLIGDGLEETIDRILHVVKGLDAGMFDALAVSLENTASLEPTLVSRIRIILFGTNAGRLLVKQKGIVHAIKYKMK
jgi:hypothetical protein